MPKTASIFVNKRPAITHFLATWDAIMPSIDWEVIVVVVVSRTKRLASGGHYIAYCRNELNGHWYEFDDTMVSRVEVAEVLTKEAYVLFYQKKSDSMNKIRDRVRSLLESGNKQVAFINVCFLIENTLTIRCFIGSQLNFDDILIYAVTYFVRGISIGLIRWLKVFGNRIKF